MTSPASSTHRLPVTLAVVSALSFFCLIVSVGLAIGGSYLLTLHEIHVQQAVAQQAQATQLQSAIQSSAAECRQIQAMDDASKGETWTSDTYGKKLATAIHSFYISSRCPILLDDLAAHKTDTQIAKDLGQ